MGIQVDVPRGDFGHLNSDCEECAMTERKLGLTPIYDELKLEFLTEQESAQRLLDEEFQEELQEELQKADADPDRDALGDSDAEYDRIKDRELDHE